jgi:hypothetical protein
MGKLRTAILIDGGHLRVLSKMARREYTPNLIEKAAHSCIDRENEEMHPIMSPHP